MKKKEENLADWQDFFCFNATKLQFLNLNSITLKNQS